MRYLVVLITWLSLFNYSRAMAYDLAEVSTPVGPQDFNSALAKQHYDAGAKAFIDKNYEAAFIEFRAGYELHAASEFLFNMSLIREQQGRYKEAIEYQEQYIAKARQELKPGETLTKDAEDQSRGRLLRLRELLAAKESQAVLGASAPAERQHARSARPPIGALVLFGIGGASLVAAIGCGAAAAAKSEQAAHGGPFYSSEYDALLSQGRALNTATVSTGIIAGAALTAATIWSLVHRFR